MQEYKKGGSRGREVGEKKVCVGIEVGGRRVRFSAAWAGCYERNDDDDDGDGNDDVFDDMKRW